MRPGRGGSDRSHPSGSLALLDELAAAPDQIIGKTPEPFERRIACLLVVIAEVDLLDDRGQSEQAIDLVELPVMRCRVHFPAVVVPDLAARQHARPALWQTGRRSRRERGGQYG